MEQHDKLLTVFTVLIFMATVFYYADLRRSKIDLCSTTLTTANVRDTQGREISPENIVKICRKINTP